MPAAKKVEAPTSGEVILDFSQVKPFEPIDPSKVYLCSVSNFARAKAKTGAVMSHLELTVVSPEEVQVEDWQQNDQGEWVPMGLKVDEKGNPVTTKAKGRKLFREYTHGASALPFLYEFLKAADPDVELNEKFKLIEKDYMGLQVACKVKNEPYGEQIRARVSKILAPSAAKV